MIFYNKFVSRLEQMNNNHRNTVGIVLLLWTLLFQGCYYLTSNDQLNQSLKREAINYLESTRLEMDEFIEDQSLQAEIEGYLETGYIPDELYKYFKVKNFSTFLFRDDNLIYWSNEQFPKNILNEILQLPEKKRASAE